MGRRARSKATGRSASRTAGARASSVSSSGSASASRFPVAVEARSGRHTPRPAPKYLFRPTWHKVIGAAMLVFGFAYIFACYLDVGHMNERLPGGHAWYLVGLAIMGGSTWWFGLPAPPA